MNLQEKVVSSTCSTCGEDKPVQDFYRISTGYRKKCMQCTKDTINARYRNNAEYREKKIAYARVKNPLRESRSLKGLV